MTTPALSPAKDKKKIEKTQFKQVKVWLKTCS